MSTKTDIIALVKAVADATGVDAMKVSLGTEGNHVELGGQSRETGAAWVPEPKPFSIVIEGLAAWFDAHGVGGKSGFRSIQVLPVSGPIIPTADLVELTTAAIGAQLPPAAMMSAGDQLVVKNVNAAGSSLIPAGADTIDGVGAPLVMPGSWDVLRLYVGGATSWRTW